mmetsp:Transcript_9304/g.22418  ORF Transcript_9304/g.22418 Transcript_9304/m.22418 type:complete len:227 (+) Transcript_9304:654-1334(+)
MAFLLLVTLLLLLLLVLLLVPLPQRFLFSLPAASARQRRASAVLGARAAARPGLPACRLGLCPRSQGPLHPLCGGLEGRHRAQRPRSISQASYSLWIVLCHRFVFALFVVFRAPSPEKHLLLVLIKLGIHSNRLPRLWFQAKSLEHQFFFLGLNRSNFLCERTLVATLFTCIPKNVSVFLPPSYGRFDRGAQVIFTELVCLYLLPVKLVLSPSRTSTGGSIVKRHI